MTSQLSRNLTERSSTVALSSQEVSRYSRQVLLPEVGLSGQKRLKAARVLIVGMGGLGSPASLYLAGAGVGTIGLAEFDLVDGSNLQRQILYRSADQGRPKIQAAASHLRSLNPHISIVEHALRVDDSNVRDLISQYDIVLDGSDNLSTRYLVADACGLGRTPLVYGAVFRFGGQVSVFYSPHGPCYRCLFPRPPAPEDVPSCAEAGILGVLPGQVGLMQATEVLKLILEFGSSLIGRLVTIDGRTCQYSEFHIPRDPQCPLCGENPLITKPNLLPRHRVSGEHCHLSLNVHSPTCEPGIDTPIPEINVFEFEKLRTSGADIRIIDVRSTEEAAICAVPGYSLLPLSHLREKISTLPKHIPVIFYCKTGRRSLEACRLCREYGLTNVLSLKDGILAWASAYLPEAPRY